MVTVTDQRGETSACCNSVPHRQDTDKMQLYIYIWRACRAGIHLRKAIMCAISKARFNVQHFTPTYKYM